MLFTSGGGGIDYAAFYSYAYPTPDGFKTSSILPEAAFFNEALGEFMLPYEAVRAASEPDALLLSFLQSSYEAAANPDPAGLSKCAPACSEGPRFPRSCRISRRP